MRSRVYSKDPAVARSLRYSVRDGVAYSIMSGAGVIYISATRSRVRRRLMVR